MYRIISLFLSALLVCAAFALPPQQHDSKSPKSPATTQTDFGEVSVEQNVLYGRVNGSELQLDVYQPGFGRGNGRRPAVLLIHGGGWVSFDKSTMQRMGEFLARNGFVAFAIDYRLFDGTENRWPAQLDDVQRAVRWVRANASKYNVNPDRIGAFGHSAGGQLAALLGMEDTRDNSDPKLARYSSKVQAVVDVSGPTDFTVQDDPEAQMFLTSFLGAEYKKHPEIWRDASPVYHIDKHNAPFLIVHGTKDEDVPIAQAQELYDKLHAAHVPVKLVKVDDVHTFRTPEARRELAVETIEFFNGYLGGSE